MTHGIRIRLTALVGVLACVGAAAAATRHELVHGGRAREYWVQAPRGPAAALVMALHGGGGTAAHMPRADGGRLVELAARDDVLLVFPQGVQRSWNDGRGTAIIKAEVRKVDDVGFLRALSERLLVEYRIPPGRVYFTGISNGGFMSFRMACEAADLVAAVAPVTANLSENLGRTCAPDRPVAVLIVDGTEDPLVPYQGGEVTVLRTRRGAVRSAPASARFFAEANGCDPAAHTRVLPDRDPGDGTFTRVHEFQDCRARADVTLLEVDGGGHTWPGGPQYLPRFLIGGVARDFHASDVIWEFFRDHPRR